MLCAMRTAVRSVKPFTQGRSPVVFAIRCASTAGPLSRYHSMIRSGEINKDRSQEKVIELFDDLAKQMQNHVPRPANVRAQATPKSSSGGGFFGLFGSKKAVSKAPPPKREVAMEPSGPKGLYVWGGCGTGKTFLMDLFYSSVDCKHKKRIHFHEWMIHVHERLHTLQKGSAKVQNKANTVWTAEAALMQQQELKANANNEVKTESSDDLVERVAQEMMNEAWLLCFDEFQVTHISDAILMKRLFSHLWEKGCVVVATSNRPPEDLYLHGLNRPLFLPFIPMIKGFCNVHDIASETDYRLISAGEDDDKRVYMTPNNHEINLLLEKKFFRFCHGEVQSGAYVETQGRRLAIPKAAENTNVALFSFKDLCDKALGAADYLALATTFHTIFLSDIPQLTLQERDQVRRFITLVDALYEKHVKLVCSAAADPQTLFRVTEEERRQSVADEIFAWDRTVSRLVEMQSTKYLHDSARGMVPEQFLGQFKLTSLTDDDIAEMWVRYDKNDNGELEQKELLEMLEDISEKHHGHRDVSEETCQRVQMELDHDKDGKISYPDFAKYMKNFEMLAAAMRL